MTKKVKGPVRPEFPRVLETFHRVGDWDLNRLTENGHSIFNGVVSLRRYRITVEEIVEPKEVLTARLQDLWDRSDNHHEWGPLKCTAHGLGYELKGSAGSKRKTK